MASIIGALIIAEMAIVLVRNFIGTTNAVLPPGAQAELSNTAALGKLIYTDYIYVRSGRRHPAGGHHRCRCTDPAPRKDVKAQDVGAQLRVRRDERVRLVKLPAEAGPKRMPRHANKN
jgi:NADH-quinone oxidoreductase subunit J